MLNQQNAVIEFDNRKFEILQIDVLKFGALVIRHFNSETFSFFLEIKCL